LFSVVLYRVLLNLLNYKTTLNKKTKYYSVLKISSSHKMIPEKHTALPQNALKLPSECLEIALRLPSECLETALRVPSNSHILHSPSTLLPLYLHR